MADFGATSPFAQEALNGCLPRPYLPFGARRQGFWVARAIVVLKGNAIAYASKANERASDAVFWPCRCPL
jgi:hypothetical protein